MFDFAATLNLAIHQAITSVVEPLHKRITELDETILQLQADLEVAKLNAEPKTYETENFGVAVRNCVNDYLSECGVLNEDDVDSIATRAAERYFENDVDIECMINDCLSNASISINC